MTLLEMCEIHTYTLTYFFYTRTGSASTSSGTSGGPSYATPRGALSDGKVERAKYAAEKRCSWGVVGAPLTR